MRGLVRVIAAAAMAHELMEARNEKRLSIFRASSSGATFGVLSGTHSSSGGIQDIFLPCPMSKDGQDSMLRRTPQNTSRQSSATRHSGAHDSDNDSQEGTNNSGWNKGSTSSCNPVSEENILVLSCPPQTAQRLPDRQSPHRGHTNPVETS